MRKILTALGVTAVLLTPTPDLDATAAPDAVVDVLNEPDPADAASCWSASFQRSGSSWCTGFPLGVRQRVQLGIRNSSTGQTGVLYGPYVEAHSGTVSRKSIPSEWSTAWYITYTRADLG